MAPLSSAVLHQNVEDISIPPCCSTCPGNRERGSRLLTGQSDSPSHPHRVPHARKAARPWPCGTRPHTPSSSTGLPQLCGSHQAEPWQHSASGSRRWISHRACTSSTCSFCPWKRKTAGVNQEPPSSLRWSVVWSGDPDLDLRQCLHSQHVLLATSAITNLRK